MDRRQVGEAICYIRGEAGAGWPRIYRSDGIAHPSWERSRSIWPGVSQSAFVHIFFELLAILKPVLSLTKERHFR